MSSGVSTATMFGGNKRGVFTEEVSQRQMPKAYFTDACSAVGQM